MSTMHSASPALDRTRRNAKIVKLLRARKLTMAEIGGMFGLSTGAIALIAKAHGASRGVRPFDPQMVRKAIRLIDRGMPVSHAAQIVGLRADSLMIHPEKRGLYERQSGRTGRGRIAKCACCVATTASPDIRCSQLAPRSTAPTMRLHQMLIGWDELAAQTSRSVRSSATTLCLTAMASAALRPSGCRRASRGSRT